jgi:hypothetical protein
MHLAIKIVRFPTGLPLRADGTEALEGEWIGSKHLRLEIRSQFGFPHSLGPGNCCNFQRRTRVPIQEALAPGVVWSGKRVPTVLKQRID